MKNNKFGSMGKGTEGEVCWVLPPISYKSSANGDCVLKWQLQAACFSVYHFIYFGINRGNKRREVSLQSRRTGSVLLKMTPSAGSGLNSPREPNVVVYRVW